MRFLLALAACSTAFACASPKGSSALGDAGAAAKAPAAAAPTMGTLDPSLTVATINGTAVTGRELDEAIHGEISHATDSYLEQVQKLREDGLEELVREKLATLEAQARGITTKELVEKEISAKAAAPTDADVQNFYDTVVKPQYGNLPMDAVKPQIVRQMQQVKAEERAKAFFDELRAKYKVKVSLPVRRLEVQAVGPSRGPADAKVTIVEWSDFQCPYCSKATPTIEAFMKKYEGKVRFVFRQFPLPFHDNAAKAAEAALCANEQSKFWPMYDKLFANQQRLQPSDMKGYAKELGLDTAKFDSCLDSGKMHSAVEADIAAGKSVGVDGTPAFFINGRPYSGAQPLEKFEEVIDAELSNG